MHQPNEAEWSAAIDRNYDAFLRQVADHLPEQQNRYALLCDSRIIEFFDTAGQAYTRGVELYGEQPFSIQPVELNAVELGWLSRVGS